MISDGNKDNPVGPNEIVINTGEQAPLARRNSGMGSNAEGDRSRQLMDFIRSRAPFWIEPSDPYWIAYPDDNQDVIADIREVFERPIEPASLATVRQAMDELGFGVEDTVPDGRIDAHLKGRIDIGGSQYTLHFDDFGRIVLVEHLRSPNQRPRLSADNSHFIEDTKVEEGDQSWENPISSNMPTTTGAGMLDRYQPAPAPTPVSPDRLQYERREFRYEDDGKVFKQSFNYPDLQFDDAFVYGENGRLIEMSRNFFPQVISTGDSRRRPSYYRVTIS